VLVDADQETIDRCTSDPLYNDLSTISASDPVGVMVLPIEAAAKTRADVRFKRIITAVNRCVHRSGLDVEAGELGGPRIDQHWSPKRVLAAFLVDARCRDKLHAIQKAADINAEYQSALIDTHLDELIKTREVAAARADNAVEILRELNLI
jgi:hypothetical protein